LSLCGVLLVLQAANLDCGWFDPFSFQQDFLGASEVDVSRCEIAQALVIAPMGVVLDEFVDFGFQVARQIIVLKQDAVHERLMPALGFWSSDFIRFYEGEWRPAIDYPWSIALTEENQDDTT
jgi:hypothetical protein